MQITTVPQQHTFRIKHQPSSSARDSERWDHDDRYNVAKCYLFMINVQRNSRAAARVYSKCHPKDRDKMHQTITDELHGVREIGSVGLKINKLIRCNFRLKTEEVSVAILKLQLSTQR